MLNRHISRLLHRKVERGLESAFFELFVFVEEHEMHVTTCLVALVCLLWSPSRYNGRALGVGHN